MRKGATYITPQLTGSEILRHTAGKVVMKYGKVNMGQMEAAINILGGEEGLNDLLAGNLVITKKLALPSARPVVKNGELDWAKAYEVLGMKKGYAKFLNEISVRLVAPNFWDVQVLKGVTCDKVIKALRMLDVTCDL